MTPRPHFFVFPISAAIALIAAGCNSSGSERSFTTIRKPAMPTVGPQETAAEQQAPSRDARETVLQRARSGDVAAASLALQDLSDGAERVRLAGEIAGVLSDEDPARGTAFAGA